jgi:hypothetical protein
MDCVGVLNSCAAIFINSLCIKSCSFNCTLAFSKELIAVFNSLVLASTLPLNFLLNKPIIIEIKNAIMPIANKEPIVKFCCCRIRSSTSVAKLCCVLRVT